MRKKMIPMLIKEIGIIILSMALENFNLKMEMHMRETLLMVRRMDLAQ